MRRFGKYLLLDKISTGGMADVYRATARTGPHAGREVAIKVLPHGHAGSPEAQARFVRDARTGEIALVDAGSNAG